MLCGTRGEVTSTVDVDEDEEGWFDDAWEDDEGRRDRGGAVVVAGEEAGMEGKKDLVRGEERSLSG